MDIQGCPLDGPFLNNALQTLGTRQWTECHTGWNASPHICKFVHTKGQFPVISESISMILDSRRKTKDHRTSELNQGQRSCEDTGYILGLLPRINSLFQWGLSSDSE